MPGLFPGEPAPVTQPGPRGILLAGLSVTFLFLATIAVVLRIYCRRLKRAGLGADDYWIIVSLVVGAMSE